MHNSLILANFALFFIFDSIKLTTTYMKKLFFLLIAILVQLSAIAASWTLNGTSYTVTQTNQYTVGSATTYTSATLKSSGGDVMRIFYSVTDLTNPKVEVRVVPASKTSFSTKTVGNTSATITDATPIVGINAGFFNMTGTPHPNGFQVIDGKARKGFSGDGFATIAFDKDNNPYIGHFAPMTCWIGNTATGAEGWTDYAAINTTSSYATSCGVSEQFIFYTPEYGASSSGGYAVKLTPVDGAKLTPGAYSKWKVETAPTTSSITANSNGIVLFGKGTKCSAFVKNLTTGTVINVYPTAQIKNNAGTISKPVCQQAAGGSLMILSQGKTITSYANTLGDISYKAPRTAVGYNSDKTKMIFCVVDGRNTGYSNGCNGKVLGDIMKNLGCYDALNLDGGGSSQFWNNKNGLVNNAAQNGNSTSYIRPVAESLFIVEKTATPSITSSASSINLTTTSSATVSSTINVSGSNLEGDINLKLSGTHANQFSITPSTIAKAIASGIVTIKYSPTTVGEHSATLTISSTNATSKTITITGSNTAPKPVISTEVTSLNLSTTNGTKVSTSLSVSGENLEGNIQFSISGTDAGQFSVSSSSISSSGNINVYYNPTTLGEHEALLTISSANATSKTVSLSGVNTKSLELTECWNFSTTKTSIPEYLTSNTIRSATYNDGYLYVLLESADKEPEVVILNAYTGSKIDVLNTNGLETARFKLSNIVAFDGKIIGSNVTNVSSDPVDTQNLYVYLWDSPTSAPQKILSANVGEEIMGAQMSVSGNMTNGRLWFTNNGTNKVMYFTITNGVVNPNMNTINLTAFAGGDGRGSATIIYNNDGTFWLEAKDTYPTLFDAEGNKQASMNPAALDNNPYGTGFNMFSYDGSDYVAAVTYTSGTTNDGKLVVIDVTNGVTSASTYDSKCPSSGLGSTANGQRLCSISQSTHDNGAALDLWVCVNGQGIAYYSTSKPTIVPSINTNVNSISFNTKNGEEVSKDITITGANLESDIILSITGNDAEQFNLSQASIAQLIRKGTVTITYTPKTAGVHSATLTISSTNADSQTIELSGNNTVEETNKLGLTRIWQNSSNIPGSSTGGDFRFAAVSNGHLLTIDKANSKIIKLTETGTTDYFDFSTIATEYYNSKAGTAISCDDAGNILLNCNFSEVKSGSNFILISSDLKNSYKIDLSTIEGYTPTRVDQIGRIIGDMLSAEGAYVFVTPDKGASILAVKIVNGAISSAELVAKGSTLTSSCIAQPAFETVAEIDELKDKSSAFYMRNRTAPNYVYSWNSEKSAMEVAYTFLNNTPEGYTTTEATNEGFDCFSLNGNKYFIMPINSNGTTAGRCTAFAIYNEQGNIVAYNLENVKVGIGQGFGSFVTVPNDKNSVFIYHFVAGTIAEKFIFTVEDSSLIGDVNNDNTIDVSDIMSLANYILSNNEEGFDSSVADVNNDGKIDVSDIMKLANIILNKE